jgi:hypothetical protein
MLVTTATPFVSRALKSACGLVAACLLIACGSASTAAEAAVQPGDLPSGLQKCDVSGAIDSFLNTIATRDPKTYATDRAEWAVAKQDGAIAAEIVLYSDSTIDCDAIHNATGSGDIASPKAPLVVSVSIQFKDEASAAKAYGSESIWGLSKSSIAKSGAAGLTQGDGAGLGTNSIALPVVLGGQQLYVAIWQNKAFLLLLLVVNVAHAQSKNIATNENGRI